MRDLPKRSEIKAKEKAESPIEELLIRELHLLGVYPIIQFKVFNYRIDLAFPDLRVGIECDGKQWHSTPEQIAYDKQREEFLNSMGWTIIRFGGSEIYRSADDIAKFLIGKKEMPFRERKSYQPVIQKEEKEELGLDVEQEIQKIENQKIKESEEDYYNKHKNDNFFSLKQIINLRYRNQRSLSGVLHQLHTKN